MKVQKRGEQGEKGGKSEQEARMIDERHFGGTSRPMCLGFFRGALLGMGIRA
jgi:hypothetical protein